MKFTCEQDVLAKAINIVSKAVTNRTTLPILKGILMEVENGKLRMVASDREITIEETIDVTESGNGAVVVQAKLFSDIIRKLPSAEVTAELKSGYVTIKCLTSQFSIVSLPADEFPAIEAISDSQDGVIFGKAALREMIRKTSFAASVDESKGVLTGILVEFLPDSVNFVAIDGYRLAVSRKAMVNTEEKNVVISAKIMNEISKILSDTSEEEDEVKLILDNKRATFIAGNVKVVLRLLDGKFIEYGNLLSEDNKIKVKVNKSDLMESIERASLLSKEGKNNLVRFAIRDSALTITSKSEEGDVKENLPIIKEGEDLDIGFNAKYALDMLKAIDDEEIFMYFCASVKPCLVKPLEGDAFEYLILPVRII